MNRFEAGLECRRYAGEPGQAMSYLLGKREVQRLAAVFARRRGVAFAAGGWAFHQVHLLYSAATFIWVLLTRSPTPARSAP